MDQTSYVRIRFQRNERTAGLTLSVPRGVERALRRGGLPDGAEARISDTSTWVPLAQHPSVLPLLSSAEPEVVLLDPHEVTQSRQYAQYLARSADLDRRVAARTLTGTRTGEPARMIVAGASDEEKDPGASLWRRQLHAVQRWAAAL